MGLIQEHGQLRVTFVPGAAFKIRILIKSLTRQQAMFDQYLTQHNLSAAECNLSELILSDTLCQ